MTSLPASAAINYGSGAPPGAPAEAPSAIPPEASVPVVPPTFIKVEKPSPPLNSAARSVMFEHMRQHPSRFFSEDGQRYEATMTFGGKHYKVCVDVEILEEQPAPVGLFDPPAPPPPAKAVAAATTTEPANPGTAKA